MYHCDPQPECFSDPKKWILNWPLEPQTGQVPAVKLYNPTAIGAGFSLAANCSTVCWSRKSLWSQSLYQTFSTSVAGGTTVATVASAGAEFMTRGAAATCPVPPHVGQSPD